MTPYGNMLPIHNETNFIIHTLDISFHKQYFIEAVRQNQQKL